MLEKSHKKFERYYLFSQVAKVLSFSQAADLLGISRGYLSEQIKLLEKEIGQSLLIRTTRTVRLTQLGEKIYRQMQGVNAQLQTLEREVEQSSSHVEGTLKITSGAIFAERYLMPACQTFTDSHTRVNFNIDVGYTNHDLNAEPFDLAIRATRTPPENMVAVKLMNYHHQCCASPNYLERFGTPTSPEQLTKHNCLSDPNLTLWSYRDGNSKLQQVQTSGDLYANDNFLLYRAALAGQGIIKLPNYLVAPAIANKQLVPFLDDFFTQELELYMIYPQQRQQSPLLKKFSQHLQHWIKNEAPR